MGVVPKDIFINNLQSRLYMFCKTCGTLLLPKKTQYGKWMACPAGHIQQEIVTTAEILTEKNIHPAKPISVGDGKNILAVHDHTCPKCGYGKAELMEIGAFYSDEDNVCKYKCGKCGYVKMVEGKIK